MLGTIVFAALFAVLTARLFTRDFRARAEQARQLPLDDGDQR
jgi:cbb3-type cytochrome oxidase subunit 3